MRKFGFKLSIIEAELNLLDAYKNQKFGHPCYSYSNSPRTITLSYSVEYLTRIIAIQNQDEALAKKTRHKADCRFHVASNFCSKQENPTIR